MQVVHGLVETLSYAVGITHEKDTPLARFTQGIALLDFLVRHLGNVVQATILPVGIPATGGAV
eukprot:scaffold952_cov409-Prasinococcus_capsulatus_cf.AAC.30